MSHFINGRKWDLLKTDSSTVLLLHVASGCGFFFRYKQSVIFSVDYYMALVTRTNDDGRTRINLLVKSTWNFFDDFLHPIWEIRANDFGHQNHRKGSFWCLLFNYLGYQKWKRWPRTATTLFWDRRNVSVHIRNRY